MNKTQYKAQNYHKNFRIIIIIIGQVYNIFEGEESGEGSGKMKARKRLAKNIVNAHVNYVFKARLQN